MIESNGDERIGERTSNIIYNHRINDIHNCHIRSIFIPCFHNYMRIVSHQLQTCIQLLDCMTPKKYSFKDKGITWMTFKVDT